MIHRATFDPGTDPVLTLSMCAIGAFYSGFANAKSFGRSLCELLRRLLVVKVSSDILPLKLSNRTLNPCAVAGRARRRQNTKVWIPGYTHIAVCAG